MSDVHLVRGLRPRTVAISIEPPETWWCTFQPDSPVASSQQSSTKVHDPNTISTVAMRVAFVC